jgi:hypothetical protein
MPSPLLFRAIRTLGVATLLASAAAIGCLPPSGSANASSPDGMTCGQRLVGGMWRFTGFTPNAPLDPQTRAAIEQLHGTLRLGFDGQRALVTGPGLYHVGAYQLASDGPIECVISAPDDRGVVTTTSVRFLDGNHLQVNDQRSAVPGVSTMERVPNGA